MTDGHDSDDDDSNDRFDAIASRYTEIRRRRLKRRVQLLVVTVLAAGTLAVRSPVQSPIRVVETGFSEIRVPDQGDGISWAVIVENTGDRAAYVVQLRVRYRLANGELDDRAWLPQVAVLRPGERIGLTGQSVPVMAGATGFEVEVDQVERWGSPDDAPRISTRGVEVGYSPENHPYVDVTAVAEADAALEAVEATAVFRDEDGVLIGGTMTSLIDEMTSDARTPIRIRAPAPFPDLATAEVYVVQRDYSPPSR